MNIDAAMTRASKNITRTFLDLFREPASMIPNTPSPCNWNKAAYIGWLCDEAGDIIIADAPVVVTVSVAVAEVAPGVTLVGDTLQVVSFGAPLHANCTALANDPPTEATVRV